jgi:hypothetical protein
VQSDWRDGTLLESQASGVAAGTRGEGNGRANQFTRNMKTFVPSLYLAVGIVLGFIVSRGPVPIPAAPQIAAANTYIQPTPFITPGLMINMASATVMGSNITAKYDIIHVDATDAIFPAPQLTSTMEYIKDNKVIASATIPAPQVQTWNCINYGTHL